MSAAVSEYCIRMRKTKHKVDKPFSVQYKSPWRFIHTSTGCIDGELDPHRSLTVEDLRASQAFTDSQVYYAPGWEYSGLSVDPQLDSAYKPHAAPCLICAVDLTGRGWPGT